VNQIVTPDVEEQLQRSEETLASLKRKHNLLKATMDALRATAFSPAKVKRLERTWGIEAAARLIGRTPSTIRLYEKENDGFPVAERSKTGRRLGYTLDQINAYRAIFDTAPGRQPEEEPCVLTFSNFKGGSGKSTVSCHFAQYLAIKGYRVLMIDCDPQGSSSVLFGVGASLQNESDDDEFTLEDYLTGVDMEFKECIQPSYFPNIDLIPADLGLFNAEYHLSSTITQDSEALNLLKNGIRQVWHNYDVIILDPPPSLGLLSLNVLAAANAMVIPMRPGVLDFDSTKEFLEMTHDQLETMINHGFPIHYNFQTIMINAMNDNKSTHVEISDAMSQMLGKTDFLAATMKDTAELENAAKQIKTVYELSEPTTSRGTYNRCVQYLDAVNSHIETNIRKTWPSQRAALREEGLL